MAITTIIKYRLSLFVFVFALIFIAGCTFLSGKNFGKFVPSADVAAAFSRAEINPDYNYYITGSDALPRSILALNKSYIFDSDLWKKVELKPEELRELVARMRQRAVDCCRDAQYGFAVLDDKGKQVGIWYSILVSGMGIKVLDDRKIIIYPPSDVNYKAYDGQEGAIGGK